MVQLKFLALLMAPILRLNLLPLLALGVATTASITPSNQNAALTRLIDWFQSNGGFISEKVEIRLADPSRTDSHGGLFATQDIRAKEVLLSLPYNLTVNARGDKQYKALECATVQTVIEERQRGQESFYAPYIDYIFEQPRGILPSTWTTLGKDLLKDILGETFEEDGTRVQALPPYAAFDILQMDWFQNCQGGTSELEVQAAELVIERAWDDLMLPVFDFVNHRNGFYTNIDSTSVHMQRTIHVRATRNIRAGEELSYTYNQCKDCAGRIDSFGTPEILMSYGFVEDFPQRWVFKDFNTVFDLDEQYDYVGNKTGKLELQWIGGAPDDTAIEFFEEQLERLVALQGTVLASRNPDIPDHEWNTATKFHQATVTALIMAIDKATSDDNNEEALPNPPMVTRYKGEYSEMISWLRAKGGIWNPKLEIRKVDPSDPDSRRAIFATDLIAPREVLMRIPDEIIIDVEHTGEALECDLVHELIHEMELAEESDYVPYIKTLTDAQDGIIPSTWSDEGKKLLHELLGKNLESETEELRPVESTEWVDDWTNVCGGEETHAAIKAMSHVLSRAWDARLVPIFDMSSHRNGLWTNVDSTSVDNFADVLVRSSREIEAGEELYITYNFCKECNLRRTNYGTGDIVRDYGFVGKCKRCLACF